MYNKESYKLWYAKNKEKKILASKSWYETNKPRALSNKRKWSKNKKITDPLYKLRRNISTLIRHSLKRQGLKKNSKTDLILGCSHKEFKQHIESLWESWMNWDNYGKYNGMLNYGWDLDHIKPISSGKSEQEYYALNHYSNYQPLCSKTNRDIKRDADVEFGTK